MPLKERDVDMPSEDGPRDKHRRSKSDRKERDHRHHRSSKSSRSKPGSRDAVDSHSHVSSSKRSRPRDKEAPGQDLEAKTPNLSCSNLTEDLAATSLDTQRVSLPYPSFSKAHSKEAVHSRDDLSTKMQSNPLTPEPTDCGTEDRHPKPTEPCGKSSSSKKGSRPPTPPDTDVSADKRQADQQEAAEAEQHDHPKSSPSRAASNSQKGSKVGRKSETSSQATLVKPSKHRSSDKGAATWVKSTSSGRLVKRSDSARSLKKHEALDDDDDSPSSAQDSSPKTPTPTAPFPPQPHAHVKRASSGMLKVRDFKTQSPPPATLQPPPPPPPPPAVDVQSIPRVDYLLQNGGLAYPVPRHFLAALPPPLAPKAQSPSLTGAESLFAPFFNILDQYSTVLSKHGSIAVATGHRSVARRLLDRLENVFSRDLPPHGCTCVMCDRSHEIHRGLTWGDVLEWVSGRIELPVWPPFDLAEIGAKAAETSAEAPRRPASPINIDPDIGEEFRDHYLRQSKKVRSAVDKWLNKTGETPVPPPQDVDDETLTFAILTNLDGRDRPYFNALLTGSRDLKSSMRCQTPALPSRSDLIAQCGLSLQRLYRLAQVPRDAECAMYLVKNHHTHDLLVTVSNINHSEWEILTSGRFDGFLWSGADADDYNAATEPRAETPSHYFGQRCTMSPAPRSSSAMGSRNTTPFSPYSRGATPASFVSLASSGMPGSRQPVSNDEEMEMAATAEMEREIYAGMEILEDAFEKLHHKAEMVRTALRQRGAGLMQSFQNRRRIDVLSNPSSGNSHGSAYERPHAGSDGDNASEDEWALDDADIMPDDSASNISSSRHRRPKRRTERRTPAPIEEDEEEP
ncbi:hypothetical protein CDD82_7864 [Ophiocordyceps australis]|uniref:5-Methylcytosine G/T mismatch-specific DNA glycosylase n=1 Tax=Ophiocordyceps australis TaxID=1399860 RepID=A0A2C5YP37_9HYPO|nr:hypothetical protein CDD82_7864 [Ophiocordyceps australis]